MQGVYKLYRHTTRKREVIL